MNFETYLDNLKTATAAEKKHQENQHLEALKKSVSELRKEGLCLFPVIFTNSLSQEKTTGQLVIFQTSYIISLSHFRKGGLVEIQSEGDTVAARVYELEAQQISLFVSEEFTFDLHNKDVKITFKEDDRTIKCMELGLRLAQENEELRSILNSKSAEIQAGFTALNNEQNHVIDTILSTQLLVSVQGPPGTGKTKTLASAIERLFHEGKKIIICAPSNTAVDELSKRLIALNLPLLRLGNDEKMDLQVLPFSLEGHLDTSRNAKMIQELQKQLAKNVQLVERTIRNFDAQASEHKRIARKEVKELRKEIRSIIQQNETELIHGRAILASTPVGLFNNLPKEFKADCTFLDEAGQCLAPLAFLTASFGKRFVQCGDPQQLPSTVKSQKAKILETSFLEYVYRKKEVLLLKTQYRMGTQIMDQINPYFYANQLESAKTSSGSFQFIDMAGFGEGETQEEEGGIFNLDEAKLVLHLIKNKKESHLDTVIISPYQGQVRKIKELIQAETPIKNVRVSTIDSFQGQEAQHVIISLVRSNHDQEIGFLKEYRRTNVAISRAKESCIVIGDSATLGGDSFFESIIQQAENQGFYQSVWELENFS